MASSAAESGCVPTVVYHKGEEKFGICLEKQIQVFKFLHPLSESYLNGSYKAPRKEAADTHLSYFMSYQSVISREPEGFVLVDNATLIPTSMEKITSSTVAPSSFEPVPAKYRDEVGIIFPNYESLVDHFLSGLCDVLDADYCIPDDIGDSEVAFLSFRPLLKAAVQDPLRVLPRSEVQIFRLEAGSSDVRDKQLSQSVLKSSQKKGKKAAPSSVSFKQAASIVLASHTDTPAAPIAAGAGRKRASRSGGSKSSSEGGTTVGSASSSSHYDGADTSHLDSSMDISGLTGLNNSSLNNSSDSPAHTAGSSDDDEAEVRHDVAFAKNDKNEGQTQQPHLRIPGPSDVYASVCLDLITAPRETSDQIASRKEQIRAVVDKSFVWMKAGPQWGKLWVKSYHKDNSDIVLYTVPLVTRFCHDVKDIQLVENLEYFHEKESMLLHLLQNPCVAEDWHQMWPRLQAAGWEHVKTDQQKKGKGKGSSAQRKPFFFPSFVARYLLEDSEGVADVSEKSVERMCERGLVPGIHLFVSRVALSRYIARFPHLLQTDEELVGTLRRYGWELEETETISEAGVKKRTRCLWVFLSEDSSSWRVRSAKNKNKPSEWIPLEELRRRVWMSPTRLFQHLADFTAPTPVAGVHGSGNKVMPLCQSVFLEAVRLEEDEALADETEENSPAVPGLNLKEMNDTVKMVASQLCSYGSGSGSALQSDKEMKEEVRLVSLLEKLKWQRKKATWTSLWWRTEEVWVAPWLDVLLQDKAASASALYLQDKPQVNRDFFFSLASVAKYVKHQTEVKGALAVDALLSQPPKGFKPFSGREEEKALIDCRLRVIANNKGPSFTKWPVHEMLISSGWLQVNAGRIGLYVPHWNASLIDPSNYTQYEAGVDFFSVGSHDDIFDHLASNGNAAAVVPEISEDEEEEDDSSSDAKAEAMVASKTPKTVAAAISCPSTSSTSSTFLVQHLGQHFEPDSVAGRIVLALSDGRHFGVIYTLLGKMSWFSAWDKDGGYLCPPWARTIEAAFAGPKKIKDRSLLQENVDFFHETAEGKEQLLQYIERNGFDRYPKFGQSESEAAMEVMEEMDVDEAATAKAEAVKAAKALRNLKKAGKNSPQAIAAAKLLEMEQMGPDSVASSQSSLVQHLGDSYEKDSAAGRIVLALSDGRHFGVIYTLLGKMSWFSAWDKDGGYLCPPWARTIEAAFAGPKKIKDRSLLQENVDFFHETAEGKEQLLQYIEKYGFDRFTAFDAKDSALDASLSFSPMEEEEEEEEVVVQEAAAEPAQLPRSDSQQSQESGRGVRNKKNIEHMGVVHTEASPGWMVLNCIERGDRFGYMWTWLQQEPLFFAQHYEPKLKLTLLCAGWALNVPGAFSATSNSANYKLADVDQLVRNVDYFHDSEEGKEALTHYIAKHGFERVLPSRESDEAENNSVGGGSPAEGRGRRRRNSIDPAKQLDPEFSIDWAAIKTVIQVGKLQVSDVNQLWAALKSVNSAYNCFSDDKGKPVYARTVSCDLYHLSSYVEGLDYFRSLRDVQLFVVQQAHLHSDERFVSNEGYMGGSYMSEEGAEEEGGEGKESVRDPSTYLTMHKRSPIKPVYKAGEAGVHIDRLVAAPSPVSPSPLSSPAGTGATVTPEHFNNPLGKAQVLTSEYPFELDMQHVIDALATSSPADDLTNGDTDFIPLTQAHVRAHASDVDEMESEEGEEEGEEFDVAVDDIISLLQSSNPNFNRIFALLSNMEESWSYFYISTGGHNLANLEGGVGRSTVWFRPNRGFSSLSMVKDEDYFYSEAALIDHLRVQYGLQSMPEHQSTSKKPRSTRSGRQLTVPDDVEEEEAQMEVEVDEASQEMVVSLDVQGRGDKKRKSRDAAAPAQAKKQKAAVADSLHNLPGASSTSMAQQPKEPAAASLRERLEEVRRSLKSTSIEHSKYSGRPESCDVGTAVGRSTEHTRILQVVVSALTNAEGVAMYLCGSPGVGKTMTVVNVLNEVAKYSRQSASDSIVSASLLNATVAGRGRRGRSGDMEVDFLERDSKQAAAEAGADLPYRVICLNGAHLREKQDAYALLAEQLRIPVDRETDLVQSVADYFLSEGQRVSLRLPGGSESGGDVQDGLSQGRSADSSPTQADFKSRTGRGARQKASTRPMSVLFIDEIDLANSEIVAHLLQLSSFSSNRTGSSSLVLLGLGNNITFLNSMRDRGAPSPEQVVFRHYDLSSLQEIVQANTADLFDSNSRKMLASKIMKAHKGDIRALTSMALQCVDEAAKQIADAPNGEELLAGPSKVIVTLAVLNKACAQKDGRVDVIGALTPRSKLLLVALLCENQHCSGGMKQSDIMRAFNTYCDHKGLGSESSSSINGFFQELLMYSVATVVKESNNPEKAKYMVNVTAQLVLQADIGELHAQELRRLVARQEKDRDALTMSQFY